MLTDHCGTISVIRGKIIAFPGPFVKKSLAKAALLLDKGRFVCRK
jgi:hypothetical protein